MSDEVRDRFEIPKEMRSIAEASVEQARKTLEKFVTSAQAAAGSIEERNAAVRASAMDVSSKAMDLPEVMRLHSEYVQAQMRSLAEQASEMGQVVGKAALDAAKPKA
jgi:hypothetical protein